METKKRLNRKEKGGIWAAPTVKLALVGVLTLVMLIPMAYIKSLIRERMNRKEQVIREIDRQWGNEVLMAGPVLQIPYNEYETVTYYQNGGKKKERRLVAERRLYIMPDSVHVRTRLQATPKRKGIYRTTVYRADAQLSGQFSFGTPKKAGVDPKDILWDKAKVLFLSTNRKGIEERMGFRSGKAEQPFYLQDSEAVSEILENGAGTAGVNVFATEVVPAGHLANGGKMEFEMRYRVRGSRRFRFIPLGVDTEMEVQSDWNDLSFTGEFLPVSTRSLTGKEGKGVSARWKIIDYQRPIGKFYRDKLPWFARYAFGLRFLVPVDDYLKSERSAKYAYLIIFLTFLVFFMMQHLSGIPMHTVHYFLTGLALVVFYVLLLSFSEHIRFNAAYWISAVATVGLLAWYAKAVLRNRRFASFVLAALSGLYVYIYVIIQLENYALLAGSIGLFLIVAGLMYASVKINWTGDR